MTLVCCSFRPWKFEYMAADLLALQLRDDHPLPPDGVLYFTQSLTHDSINIRKVCLSLCGRSVGRTRPLIPALPFPASRWRS